MAYLLTAFTVAIQRTDIIKRWMPVQAIFPLLIQLFHRAIEHLAAPRYTLTYVVTDIIPARCIPAAHAEEEEHDQWLRLTGRIPQRLFAEQDRCEIQQLRLRKATEAADLLVGEVVEIEGVRYNSALSDLAISQWLRE